MEETKARVFILVDAENRVTQIEGEWTLCNLNLDEAILVDEGDGTRYTHAQNAYLDKPLRTDDGICRYKWNGESILERTEEEMDADREAIPTPPPTEMEQMRADVDFLLMMQEG